MNDDCVVAGQQRVELCGITDIGFDKAIVRVLKIGGDRIRLPDDAKEGLGGVVQVILALMMSFVEYHFSSYVLPTSYAVWDR